MKNILMSKGAYTIVNVCAKVKKGEEVLIITEPEKIEIAEVLAAAVYQEEAEPIIAVIVPRENDGKEPPFAIAEAMKNSNVFLAAVGKSITHTRAVNNALQAGSRGIMLTQFSEDMLIKGGIEADFESIAPVCKSIKEALENGKKIRLTTSYGTDLSFSGPDRRGNALYGIVEPGEFTTIPTIEANISPVEGTTNGVIVANASIPYIGIGVLEEPVVFQVREGMIVSIEGGVQAEILKEDLKSKNDPNVYNIAEMGIGLNPKCKFTGFMLEDEGVYGSVHIGIGTSITLGGKIQAACHYDLIMTGATIEVDDRVILKDGNVNI